MRIVPFKIDGVYAGLGQVVGLLRDDGEFVTLEFTTGEQVLQVFKSAPKSVQFPIRELARVTYHRGWFADEIQIQCTSLATANEVPGSQHGLLKLAIAKRDRPAGEQFVNLLHETERKGE